MKLLGHRVIHKMYGIGTIVEQRSAAIDVAFDHLETSEIKTFQYPACFEKFLAFENEDLQTAIQTKLHAYNMKIEEQAKHESEAFQAMRAERNRIFNSTGKLAKQNEDNKPKQVNKSKRNIDSRAYSDILSTNNESQPKQKLTATAEEYNRICEKWSGSDYQNELIRQRFVNDYPIDRIMDLTLGDYLIAKEGHGNDRSFCRRLRYELACLSSMGNIRFNTFGVYYNPNDNVALSITYEKMFGNDIEAAFKYIKKEIVALLKAAEKEDYRTIDSIRLNSSFKYKLITVYYPDLYVPVVTNDILNEYCHRVGYIVNVNDPMIYRNIELRDWKNRNPELSKWSNSKLMGFCDWLWRNNRYYKRTE